MFDELVAVAKEEGNGDLLAGLTIIGKDLGLYPLTVREAYVKFMNMGAMMFATYKTVDFLVNECIIALVS